MCFHSKQSQSAQTLENRFKATFKPNTNYQPSVYNGFQFPKTPIIAHNETSAIQMFQWGLIPAWAKDEEIRKSTLNARIETIAEKPSFRNSVKQRCLVLVDGFYEWQWLDEQGKSKQKYLLHLANDDPFALAGLWNEWINQQTGEVVKTYTILTTEANELMSTIHNTKKRMPVLVSQANEMDWLTGAPLVLGNDALVAEKKRVGY
jgi:putative SOS response-associated peptidase YedK